VRAVGPDEVLVVDVEPVGALGSSESAWIVCSASGSSCGLVDPGAGQAPAGGVLPAALALAPGTFGGARWMIWSGTT
jgi:hypothetical protein